jgi:phosphoribosylamine--glycine ligase
MDVLIIGGGGREHAIALSVKKNIAVENIYIAPGNGGTSSVGVNVDIKEDNIESLLKFALDSNIDLTIVGPEYPLSLGIVDTFENHNLNVFGPSKQASKIESSKSFSKDLMSRHNVDTAKSVTFEDAEKALVYISTQDYPLVVKADGLAAGKGVYICENFSEASTAVNDLLVDKIFGSSGHTIIVEEFLDGWEVSVFTFTDGTTFSNIVGACDHKRIGDGNTGPNTGGMGAYSPPPNWTTELMKKITSNVVEPIVKGMRDEGNPYKGVLFIGLMITKTGPKVLEFNCRLGDPETQVILPLLETDLVDIIQSCIEGNLETQNVLWQDKAAACVVMASGGYPGQYETGFIIKGLKDIEPAAEIYHAGTKIDSTGQTITDGGRVLSVSALANTVEEARDKVYENINRIEFENSYKREDIGYI